MSNIFIGTSGWTYKDWQGLFYPKDLSQRKWLEYYGRHFKTVEVNSTFYRQMKPETFKNWAETVPQDFVFAVKVSRFITHIKRLERLEDFLVHCSQLIVHSKRKSMNREPRTVNRIAFEFRDQSWFDESIYKILRKYNAALVIAESGSFWPSSAEASEGKPSEEVITADFVYIRFHGEGGSYASKYTDKELKSWANRIRKWRKRGLDVYAYFNNDVAGFAIENAKTLISLIYQQVALSQSFDFAQDS
ncbi:MAG: hypothetical protein UU00_C0024G0009 [Microgenomates group bacterium GW2011_GWC1_40_35]|nr:MAG: hypothetical protein UU00_C0024G0009 [Microgenomates group bacterium GW2011_GWC1_40_35]